MLVNRVDGIFVSPPHAIPRVILIKPFRDVALSLGAIAAPLQERIFAIYHFRLSIVIVICKLKHTLCPDGCYPNIVYQAHTNIEVITRPSPPKQRYRSFGRRSGCTLPLRRINRDYTVARGRKKSTDTSSTSIYSSSPFHNLPVRGPPDFLPPSAKHSIKISPPFTLVQRGLHRQGGHPVGCCTTNTVCI